MHEEQKQIGTPFQFITFTVFIFPMELAGIKNLIFDLGGVIINLSVIKTQLAFTRLSGLTLPEVQKRVHQGVFFHDFEKGLISDDQFRASLREDLGLAVDDVSLDIAWNDMLLDIPLARLNLLESLKNQYQLYLLSNTNNIHMQRFNTIVQETTGKPKIDHYFNEAYFSHLIKLSKPDHEIYRFVLEKNNLIPEETLFLDDNKDNLAGAHAVGIRTFHVENPDQLFSLFK